MFVLNFSEVDQDQRINLPASELARPPDVAVRPAAHGADDGDDTILFAGDEMAPRRD